jgi:hypothetical protein
MTLYSTTSVTLAGATSAERGKRVVAVRVPTDFFASLGVKPALGRSFTADELRGGADRVAVVGAGVYRSRFGNDPNLSGETLRIDGKERAIAGVLPNGFQPPAMCGGFDQNKPEIWLPLDVECAKSDDDLWGRGYFVYARLRPGVRLEQARSEMTATYDPVTFGSVAAVLVAAALCATTIPARRAASVDPLQALRAE